MLFMQFSVEQPWRSSHRCDDVARVMPGAQARSVDVSVELVARDGDAEVVVRR
jgi:hypothetical protein